MDIDLDAKLAAVESEAAGEPHTLTLRGEKFTLPPKLDALGLADACRYRGLEQTARLMEALVGPEQYQRLLTFRLDDDQLSAVVEAATSLYGMTAGEPVASASSSVNGSSSSRPTSKGSTRLTSVES